MARMKKTDSHQIGFRLATPLWEKCKQIAKEEYWDVSQVIQEAIKFYLKDREQKPREEEKK